MSTTEEIKKEGEERILRILRRNQYYAVLKSGTNYIGDIHVSRGQMVEVKNVESTINIHEVYKCINDLRYLHRQDSQFKRAVLVSIKSNVAPTNKVLDRYKNGKFEEIDYSLLEEAHRNEHRDTKLSTPSENAHFELCIIDGERDITDRKLGQKLHAVLQYRRILQNCNPISWCWKFAPSFAYNRIY